MDPEYAHRLLDRLVVRPICHYCGGPLPRTPWKMEAGTMTTRLFCHRDCSENAFFSPSVPEGYQDMEVLLDYLEETGSPDRRLVEQMILWMADWSRSGASTGMARSWVGRRWI